MSDLTQMEFQNLKSLINLCDINYKKLNAYSYQCVDTQIKQMVTRSCTRHIKRKTKITNFFRLGGIGEYGRKIYGE